MDNNPGDRLRIARELLELTQDQFSKPLGLSRVNITNLESGKVKISTLHALSFEYVYKISADWLLNGSGDIFLAEKSTSNGDVVKYEHPIEAEHMKLIKEFKNKKLALELNYDLVSFEHDDPSLLYEIKGYFKRMKSEEKKDSSHTTLKGTDRRKNRAG